MHKEWPVRRSISSCAVDRVTVDQRLDREVAGTDIVGKIGQCRPLIGGVDFSGPASTLEQAAEFDHGQPTDPDLRTPAQKRIEIVRTGFVDVALGQRARIDVRSAAGIPVFSDQHFAADCDATHTPAQARPR